MDASWGELLMRWSVRLAVACIAARVAVDLTGTRATACRWARGWWTAGCLLYVLHVAAAFHFVHHWSHAAAYRSTAEETEAMTGLAWGGGLWLNYLFTVLWSFDAALWWGSPDLHRRISRVVGKVYAGWFAFIVLNATVVFGPAFWKPVGAATAAALGVLLIRRARRDRYSKT